MVGSLTISPHPNPLPKGEGGLESDTSRESNQFVPVEGVSAAGGRLEAIFTRCAAVDSALRRAIFLFLYLSALDLLCPAMVASG